MNKKEKSQSTVYITGAGPGDPELLTLKAKEIINKADVIAYDNLVSNEILELALLENPNVKLIFIGKSGSDKTKSVSQDQINKLLFELSKEYKIICRLKGGDPNIFGRGGEEASFLEANNVNFEIIPGVSSITAVPAYAGIPITHRDFTSSFTVITAHEDPLNPESKIRWENFDAVNSTIILLMGVKNLSKIIEKLLILGRNPETPVAIIFWGTIGGQKTLTTKLKSALTDIKKEGINAPSVIVIGEVVNCRKTMNWFESKPLFGKRILITRTKEQALPFASKLIKSGANPIIAPVVNYHITEQEIYNKGIINNLPLFDWIFFTSQNAVRFFFEILNKNYYDSRILSKTKIAAVGIKTKSELLKYNIKADFIPKRFSLEDLITELSETEDLTQKKILLPTQNLPEHKILKNLNVVRWGIYDAVFLEAFDEITLAKINEGIDVITLFSPNTSEHIAKLFEKHNLLPVLNNAQIATIGDETAKIAKELFKKVHIKAEPFTEEGLISSIEDYYSVKDLVLEKQNK
jgi:uroporphyrinogen III methyltransferase/synthase